MAEKVMGHEYELPQSHGYSKEARGCVRRVSGQAFLSVGISLRLV